MKWSGWTFICCILLNAGCGGGTKNVSSDNTGNGPLTPQSARFHVTSEQGWGHLHIDVPAGYDRLRIAVEPAWYTHTHILVSHEDRGNDQMIDGGAVGCHMVIVDSDDTQICEIENPDEGRWYVSIKHVSGVRSYEVFAFYDKRISRHADGAVAGATFDPGNATFVNDGVTDGGHWSGNVDDMVWIDFGQEYKITEIKVYADLVGNVPLAISLLDTDTEGFEESPPDLYFIIDGMSWTTSAGNECRGLTFSSGSLTCTMGSGWPDSRAIFVLLDPGSGSQSGDEVEIREIEVHGWLRNP